MAKHEFGIMQAPPVKGQRYDEYEPEKYNCISVPDDVIVSLLEPLSDITFFWHTVDIQGKGLAYCGVTLLSPSMIEKLLLVIKDIPAVATLTELLKKALSENKYVIHFGI